MANLPQFATSKNSNLKDLLFGSDVSNGVHQQTVITSYLWGLNIYNQLQHTNIYAPVKD